MTGGARSARRAVVGAAAVAVLVGLACVQGCQAGGVAAAGPRAGAGAGVGAGAGAGRLAGGADGRPAPLVPPVAAWPMLTWGALPQVARPLAVRLRLELQPRAAEFTGEVELDVEITESTSVLWLHASELVVEHAELLSRGKAALPLRAAPGAQGVLALRAPAALAPGLATLRLRYRGRISGDEQEPERGLFRRVVDGRSYLFSQGQAQYARRITPCFDEPRWKVPWQVTVIAPSGEVALGNAPLVRARALPGGLQQHEFAPTAPMPSYLLAVAVGPFELISLPPGGRGGVPLRLVLPRGQAGRAALAAEMAPRAVAAVEDFLGLPLPLPKLDLVAVPRFFGGMENPGLITLDAEHVLGGPGVEGPQQLGHRAALARLLVHELAHQWFGNLITPASWQDLWISEGFATWVSTRKLRAMPELDSEVARGLSWVSARQADAAGDRAVRRWAHATPQRPGPTAAQLEELGDAIIYEKSASVLHMMSHWLGEERFTAAVRAFLLARAGDAVSGEELARALAVLRPEAPGVLLRQLDNRGVPRVRFSLRCAAGPAAGPGAAGPGAAGPAAVVDIEIQAEQGAMPLPVCLRFPDARGKISSLCQLVVAKGQVALPTDTCPAWLSGNDDLSGYYDAQGSLPAGHPRHPRPWVPSWARTTAERLGLGAEHALRVPDAAQVPAALAFVIERVDAGAASAASAASVASAAPTASAAARRELLEHALGDLGLIERLEPLIAEPQLPAWRRLVSRHAEQLGGALFDPESGAALERWVAAQSAAILTEVPWPRLATERARAALALGVSSAAAGTLAQAWRVALRDASPSAAAATTAELLRAVARASGAEADELLAALAAIPPSGVPLLFAALDATPPPGVTSAPAAGQAAGATLTWSRAAPVVTALLRRRSTQVATLAALPSRMAALRQAVAPVELVPILRALGRLCSPEHRAAAVALFSAAGEVPGRAELEQSVLTSIQHCPAWQAQRAAHVGAALAPFSASAP